jgi:hypothetical protein
MPWMPEVFTAPIAEARRVQEEGEATGTNDAVPCYEGSYKRYRGLCGVPGAGDSGGIGAGLCRILDMDFRKSTFPYVG